jgi:hypothetical protein
MRDTTTVFETFYVDVTQVNCEQRLADALEEDGLVTFDNIGSQEDLMNLARKLGTIVRHRDADAEGLTRIAQRDEMIQKAGYAAFSSGPLPLHTDRSGEAEPPTLVILLCSQPASEGGISLFADGKQIYHILAEQFPYLLEKLATPSSAIFGGANTLLPSSVFSTLDNSTICLRFRYDSLGYYSAPITAVLPTFLEILHLHSISFPLGKSQGYIIQNGRWLHGRTAFRGKREMYRVLVKTNDETPLGKRIHLGFIPLRRDAELSILE